MQSQSPNYWTWLATLFSRSDSFSGPALSDACHYGYFRGDLPLDTVYSLRTAGGTCYVDARTLSIME